MQQPDERKRIVTIGGGTGSFVVLSGLKQYPLHISAIVSMADDGGSTGLLRDELGVLPPGDVRQCLIALSESSETLRTLMGYRFEQGGLRGHNFGNLFLSALEKTCGDFASGVEEASKILTVKGDVIPVTQENIKLYMELHDKTVLSGESEIYVSTDIQKKGMKRLFLKPSTPKAHPKAVRAIMKADIIVIGPGTHYSSILPNFLIDGIPKAIKNTKATVVYVCNLVNKKGQTERFTLDDYVRAIESHIGEGRIDVVLYNTQKPPKVVVDRYEEKEELLVEDKLPMGTDRSYRVIADDMLSARAITYSKADAIAAQRSLIRHDGEKIAKILMSLAIKNDRTT